MERTILVLGVGNTLLSDEGLGVAAVQRLMENYRFGPEVEVLDGGTLGLDLLHRLEGVQHLFVVDAVWTGGAPGELVRLEGEEIPKVLATKTSMHQVGLQELLAVSALRGTLPPHVVLWGMAPASLDWGVELTPVIAGQLDLLVQALAQELSTYTQQLLRLGPYRISSARPRPGSIHGRAGRPGVRRTPCTGRTNGSSAAPRPASPGRPPVSR